MMGLRAALFFGEASWYAGISFCDDHCADMLSAKIKTERAEKRRIFIAAIFYPDLAAEITVLGQNTSNLRVRIAWTCHHSKQLQWTKCLTTLSKSLPRRAAA